MIKSELIRILKSTKGRIISLVFIIVPFIDIILNWREDFSGYEGFEHLIYENLSHPSYASFLSGSSQGHILQILLIWVLPIYLLIAYADTGVSDLNVGFSNYAIMRSSKKRYYFSKLTVAFIYPLLLSFISLTINFIICNIIFLDGHSFGGLEQDISSTGILFELTISKPFISYFCYIIIFSLICGFVGVSAISIAFISKNNFITYPVVFFIWFLQIVSEYSITYTIQPFIEYGLKYLLIGFGVCILITVLSLIVLYYARIRKDEI